MTEIVEATEDALPTVRLLNEAEIPHVNSVSLGEFGWFLGHADYFRLALLEGRIAGFLIGFLPGSSYDSMNYRWFSDRYDRFVYIDRIVVDPRMRGRGVGRALYRDIAGYATGKSPLLTCEVNIRPANAGSTAFHRAEGFVEVGRQETEGGKKLVSLLAKTL